MTRLWFVTPAWQRYELTEVCLEQRRRVIDVLRSHGVDANCVVIADDDNLDIARGFGFATVERDNEWLGRRFNDGYQYALEQGADHVAAIGSDSWIDPRYFLPMPKGNPRWVRSSMVYAPVEADRMAVIRVTRMRNPAGPHLFHRRLLRKAQGRPAADEQASGIDSSTIRGLWPFKWDFREVHELQYIGFRHAPFITPYEALWERWGVREFTDPWPRLAQHFPLDLVDRARRVLCNQ